MDFLITVISHWKEALAVVLVLGGLIFFHELGHFLMARLLGIGVRTFSLGFGPKLATVRGGKTDYCLSLVPLGGYVSLAGEEEESDEDRTAERNAERGPGEVVFTPDEEFSRRPAWNRLLVVLAGPVANFLLAFLLYWGIAWAQGQTFLLPEIGAVVAGSPAAEAGLAAGDTITSINGAAVHNWRQVPDTIVATGGKPVTLTVSNQGVERTITLTPKAGTVPTVFGEQRQTWLLGIEASGKTGTLPLGPGQAFVAGLDRTWGMITFTCESIVKLVQRVVPLDNVGGPILIAQMIGQQTENGVLSVLLLAALISVNLGILNLLPIPVLDGGHIVFFLAEMAIGKPVSAHFRAVSAQVGMVLLLALMVFATWNDLARLFS